MKIHLLCSSYTYNGEKIYENDGKWYVYVDSRGQHRKEFVNDTDAEYYIDNYLKNDRKKLSVSHEATQDSSIEKNDTLGLYVVARILRKDIDTWSNYMYLQDNGRYYYRGQDGARRMSYKDASKIVESHKADNFYIYKAIHLTK